MSMARFPQDMTERFTVIRDGKELEVCVLCGAVTDVEFSTPIEERKGYREGAGQPCRKCGKQIQAEQDNDCRGG